MSSPAEKENQNRDFASTQKLMTKSAIELRKGREALQNKLRARQVEAKAIREKYEAESKKLQKRREEVARVKGMLNNVNTRVCHMKSDQAQWQNCADTLSKETEKLATEQLELEDQIDKDSEEFIERLEKTAGAQRSLYMDSKREKCEDEIPKLMDRDQSSKSDTSSIDGELREVESKLRAMSLAAADVQKRSFGVGEDQKMFMHAQCQTLRKNLVRKLISTRATSLQLDRKKAELAATQLDA